jgi:membrane fusion protein (multidrug efflux system)
MAALAAETPIEAIDAPAKRAGPRAPLVLGALLGAAALAATAYFAATRGQESTDDAQVEGHVASVASRVSGQARRVLVKDNQEVAAGDLLVELDARDFRVKAAAARADVDAAQAALVAAEKQLALMEKTVGANLRQARGGMVQADAVQATADATIGQAKAEVAVAESRRALAKLELARAETLLAEAAIAQAEVESRRALDDQAVANVAQAQARLRVAKAGTFNSAGNLQGVELHRGARVHARPPAD